MAELGEALAETTKRAVEGVLAPVGEHIALVECRVSVSYTHNITKTTELGGTVGIAIGPANVSLTGRTEQRVEMQASLSVEVLYRGREQNTLKALPEETDAGSG